MNISFPANCADSKNIAKRKSSQKIALNNLYSSGKPLVSFNGASDRLELSDESKFKTKLTETEAAIKNKEKQEFHFIDKKGETKLIVASPNTEPLNLTAGDIPEKNKKDLIDSTCTFNNAVSLTVPDLMLALELGLAEIRVVTDNGIFSIKLTKPGSQTKSRFSKAGLKRDDFYRLEGKIEKEKLAELKKEHKNSQKHTEVFNLLEIIYSPSNTTEQLNQAIEKFNKLMETKEYADIYNEFLKISNDTICTVISNIPVLKPFGIEYSFKPLDSKISWDGYNLWVHNKEEIEKYHLEEIKPGDGLKNISKEGAIKLQENLNRIEMVIKNLDKEEMHFFDPDGNEKLVVKGKENEACSKGIANLMFNARIFNGFIATHNHPGSTYENLSFSNSDILNMIKLGLRELRATTKKGTYIMRFGKFKTHNETCDFNEFVKLTSAIEEKAKNDALDKLAGKSERHKKMCDLMRLTYNYEEKGPQNVPLQAILELNKLLLNKPFFKIYAEAFMLIRDLKCKYLANSNYGRNFDLEYKFKPWNATREFNSYEEWLKAP